MMAVTLGGRDYWADRLITHTQCPKTMGADA
jgi:hypothetical protein